MTKLASAQPRLTPTKTATPQKAASTAPAQGPKAASTAPALGPNTAPDKFEAGAGKSTLPQGDAAAQDGKFARAGDLLSAIRAGADPTQAVDALSKGIPGSTLGGQTDAGFTPDLPGIGEGAVSEGQDNFDPLGAGLFGAGADDAAGEQTGPGAFGLDGAKNETPGRTGRDALLTQGLTGGHEGQGNNNEPPGIGAHTGPTRGNLATGLMDGADDSSGKENWQMTSSMTDKQKSDGGQSIRSETTGKNVDTGQTITDVSTHESDGKGNSVETQEVTVKDSEGNVTDHEKTTTTTSADGTTTTTTESNTDGKSSGLTHSLEPGSGVARPSNDVLRKILGNGQGPRPEESNPNPESDGEATVTSAQVQAQLKRRIGGLVNPSEPGAGQPARGGPVERNRDPVINPNPND